MKVPISWLKEYLDISLEPKDIAKKFTDIGYMLDKPQINVGEDVVLDLEVRQNRADCLSLIGLARDLGAVLESPLKLPELHNLSTDLQKNETSVTIEDPNHCYRFGALRLKNIKNLTSPDWMISRLEAYGIKTINAIVDITNYVMVEYGQPLHGYDADKLADKGKNLVVRRAKEGEKITLFGNRVLTLTTDDIIVANNDIPVSLAGIMGGSETGLSENTNEILLEAAKFNQAHVRRTTLRHDVRTESSTRQEKFIHPQSVELALARAAKLYIDITGAEIAEYCDVYPLKMEPTVIDLRTSQIRNLGGVDVSIDTIKKILHALEISIENESEGILTCMIPYFRTDVTEEADLVEEVIRIYGYENIQEAALPSAPETDLQSKASLFEESLRNTFVGLGFDEQITEPLVSEASPERDPVLLQNSLTSEKTMLRTTLQHSLEYAATSRKKYRLDEVRLFEIGKIYFKDHDSYKEEKVLGALWYAESAPTFRDFKGYIEVALAENGFLLQNDNVEYAYVDSKTLYAQVYIEKLNEHGTRNTLKILSSPPQLLVQDFKITLEHADKVGDIIQAIRALDERIYTVELKEDPRITETAKEILLHVTFKGDNTTLRTEDIEPLRQKIYSFSK